MTIETYSYTLKDVKLASWYPNYPIPRLTYYGDFIVDQNWGSNYVTEHRVKPPEPLWMYPTSREKVFKVENATPMTGVYRSGYPGISYRMVRYERGWSTGAPSVLNQVYPDTSTSLRLKVQDTAANISSSVAEYKMLHEGFLTFANNMRKIKRRMLKQGGPKLDLTDVASTHLALHFGVKPTVQDFYSVLEKAIPKIWEPPAVQVSAQVSRPFKTEIVSNPSHFTYEGTVSTRSKVYVKPKAGSSNVDIGNPLEWAWELIPFSFVIDWAIPIGDYITAFFALSNVDLVSPVSHTHVIKCSMKQTRYIGGALNSYDWVEWEDGHGDLSSYERTITSGIPLPPFPGFDPSIGLLRAQHATALLVSIRDSIQRGKKLPKFK